MKEITVQKNDSQQKLIKFLMKYLKNMPSGLIYKAIRKKRIKVNGKRGRADYVLKEGDVLELYINDEFFKEYKHVFLEEPEIKIVYEDENILIADKPSGQNIHGGDDSLLEHLWSYLIKRGEYDPEKENSFAPAFCNRIDKNTRGIVIAAKSAASLRAINEKIKERKIRKFYLCSLCATPEKISGEISTYLKKNEQENKVYVCGKNVNGAQSATTRYNIIKVFEDGRALVEAELVTGRTHQIRVHMAYIGCPICGDVKYGAPKNNKKEYQELISYKIVFDFEEDGSVISNLAGRSFSIIQNTNVLY